MENMPKVKEIFEEQLKKCQVEYFDFYIFQDAKGKVELLEKWNIPIWVMEFLVLRMRLLKRQLCLVPDATTAYQNVLRKSIFHLVCPQTIHIRRNLQNLQRGWEDSMAEKIVFNFS